MEVSEQVVKKLDRNTKATKTSNFLHKKAFPVAHVGNHNLNSHEVRDRNFDLNSDSCSNDHLHLTYVIRRLNLHIKWMVHWVMYQMLWKPIL